MEEMWHLFPRILEQKINGLLDRAEPNPTKTFHLYKSCQRENLWSGSYEDFAKAIRTYFEKLGPHRRKSDLDNVMNQPLDSLMFEDFNLDFRCASINAKELSNVASWAHHMIRINCKTNCVVASLDVLGRTLGYVTNPPQFEKARDILFEDFTESWKKIVNQLFGNRYDSEFGRILEEIKWLDEQIKLREVEKSDGKFIPTIYLTQTEIDWVNEIIEGVNEGFVIPEFPLSRGPEKQRLIELERVADLYRIVQKTSLPELIKHREKIKVTLLERCESILRERAR